MAARTAEAKAALATAMARQLLAGDTRPDIAAARALELLEEALGPNVVALLSVLSAAGAPIVRAGRIGVAVGRTDSGHMVIARRTPKQPAVTLAVARQDGRSLTILQCELIESAAGLLQSWSGRVASKGERRAAARGVDDVLDGFAEQAADRGVSVSALVFASPQLVFRPGLTRAWVAQARAIMRASDIVGMLGDAEIGFLLYDTNDAQAPRAAARLRHMLAGDDVALRDALAIGVATRGPGRTTTRSVLQEARDNAAGPQRSLEIDAPGPEV
jgi:hypothetical protein